MSGFPFLAFNAKTRFSYSRVTSRVISRSSRFPRIFHLCDIAAFAGLLLLRLATGYKSAWDHVILDERFMESAGFYYQISISNLLFFEAARGATLEPHLKGAKIHAICGAKAGGAFSSVPAM